MFENTDILGFVAAGLVFATFCMRSMHMLRCVAVMSNIAFVAYGFTADLLPILLLHALLLPINLAWLLLPERLMLWSEKRRFVE